MQKRKSSNLKGRKSVHCLQLRTRAFAFVLKIVTLSADIDYVFGAVCVDLIVPAMFPDFSWVNEFGREVLGGLCNWHSYEPQAKESFSECCILP